MMGSPKEIVGFHFQEIPLDEAVNAVIAGDGNYAGIKAKLLEALPNLESGKAFAFGLPNGKEVTEESRRGICMSVNSTLKKAKLPWRVTYSGTKRLFICVPKTARSAEKATPPPSTYVPRSNYNNMDNSGILTLWRQGATVKEIVAQTGSPLQRVRYVCYSLYPRKTLIPPTHPGDGKLDDKEAIELTGKIVNAAMRIFKVDAELINERGNSRSKAIRKAICVVACNQDVPPRIVAPFVNLTPDGVSFNWKAKTAMGKEEIKKLSLAL